MKKTISILKSEFMNVEAAIAALTDSTQANMLKQGWDNPAAQAFEFDVKDAVKSVLDKAVENITNGDNEASAKSFSEPGRKIGQVITFEHEMVEGNFNGRPFFGWQIIDANTLQPAKRTDGTPVILSAKGVIRGLHLNGNSSLKAEGEKPVKEFLTYVSGLGKLKVAAKQPNTFGGFDYLYDIA